MKENKDNKRENETPDLNFKAIFSDIDGTLLDSNHQVPPNTGREIRRLETLHVPFVLVSARMPEAMTTIKADIGICSPMVCYSGALVVGENGEHLYSCQVGLLEALEIKAMLDKEYPFICCNTYGGSKWVVDNDENAWVKREEEITSLKAKVGSIEHEFKVEQGIHKFLLMGQKEEILKVQKRIEKDYPHLSVSRSNEYYLEVMNGAVMKSKGVEFLCNHYGISMDDAIAFGDGHNDIDMLKAVKTSYAMGNAPRVVRESAARVTLDNDHEGLLAALKECFGYSESEMRLEEGSLS
ncbi:Cof-type HAD-IIB family hydrolase [Lacrimispora algidixylanolytica]|uniref:Haloacid dehalogenase n=1 Tax=Lacrimispora algidixylanolytica TaxID=94868 RepID=A0A419T7P4_9FIRM|nr:Cof-type HAD-IIB family hydrolase [Lacrimispora algidixylanolytica]RKD33607.1 haloacid dehalogenase [Lacrimispora algidixylanolytica]